MTFTIDVVRGSIRLPVALVETFLPGVEAVAVLIDDTTLRILPVRHLAAGGCLLKHCNLAGDRVAAAFDAFESRGLGNWESAGLPVRWSSPDAALLAKLPSELQT